MQLRRLTRNLQLSLNSYRSWFAGTLGYRARTTHRQTCFNPASSIVRQLPVLKRSRLPVHQVSKPCATARPEHGMRPRTILRSERSNIPVQYQTGFCATHNIPPPIITRHSRRDHNRTSIAFHRSQINQCSYKEGQAGS
jgi:hypothetical protein